MIDITRHATTLDQRRRREERLEGNYFVSAYPPFSCWAKENVVAAERVLDTPAVSAEGVPLGLYLHIPFCVRRCQYCYYLSYVGRSHEQIDRYLDALITEAAIYADARALAGRHVTFVYFGGGTPSFLSPKQLTRLVDRLRANISWDQAEEVTFECEPGTLSETKVHTLRDLGITRLSLGVEHFDDEVLRENGRAHESKEIYKAWPWIQKAGFYNINLDLIAGMVGDTDEKWKETVRRTVELEPDSVTIYQMELPLDRKSVV